MYKNLAVLLLVVLLGAGGYNIVRSGGIDVLRNAYTNDPKTNLNPPSAETVAGLYACTMRSGCNHKYMILLKDDMTMELLLSSDNVEDTTKSNDTSTSVGINSGKDSSPVSSIHIPSTSTDTDTTMDDDQDTTVPSRAYLNSIIDLPNIEPLSDIKKGTWALIRGTVLILTITQEGETILDKPQKIIINKIEPSLLSRVSYNKIEYTDMIKPVFLRENY